MAESNGTVHFVMHGCNRHGCFVGKRGRSQEFYTRKEVIDQLMLYLLLREIDYAELVRTLKLLTQVQFPSARSPCSLPEAPS